MTFQIVCSSDVMNATRQALQLVCQPIPFDERDYTRVTHYACKDLFWTFKFLTTEESFGLLNERITRRDDYAWPSYFNIEPEKQMQWWNQYWSVIEVGIAYSRHMMQTLIGKDLKCLENVLPLVQHVNFCVDNYDQ